MLLPTTGHRGSQQIKNIVLVHNAAAYRVDILLTEYACIPETQTHKQKKNAYQAGATSSENLRCSGVHARTCRRWVVTLGPAEGQGRSACAATLVCMVVATRF